MPTMDLTTPPTSDDEGIAPIKTPVNVKEMRALSLTGSDDDNDEYHDEECKKVQPKRKRKSPPKKTKGKKRKVEEVLCDEAIDNGQTGSPSKAKKCKKYDSRPWTHEEGE